MNLIISRLHCWAVRLKAIIKRNEVEFAPLQFDCVACMMCQCSVLLKTKLSSAMCFIAVNICWDSVVKYLTDSVRWLSVSRKYSNDWHGARYHGRHGERWLCAYQMAGCFVPSVGHVCHLFGTYGWSFYEWRIVWLWPGNNFDVFCVFVSTATHNI